MLYHPLALALFLFFGGVFFIATRPPVLNPVMSGIIALISAANFALAFQP